MAEFFALFSFFEEVGFKPIIIFLTAIGLLIIISLGLKKLSEQLEDECKYKTPYTARNYRDRRTIQHDNILRKIIKKRCKQKILTGNSLKEGYCWYSPKGTIAFKSILQHYDGRLRYDGMLRPLYVSLDEDFELVDDSPEKKITIENPFKFGSEEAKKYDYNIIISNNYVIDKDDYSRCTYNSSFIHLHTNTYILTNGTLGWKEFLEFYDKLEDTKEDLPDLLISKKELTTYTPKINPRKRKCVL